LKIIYFDQHDNQKEYLLQSEYAIRQTLHKSFLYSSAFIIEKEPENDKIPRSFKLRGAGWGHGAGLCQIGALGMALSGYSVKEIMAHYYKNSELKKIY
jgi:SpoIID/LytB domain protein